MMTMMTLAWTSLKIFFPNHPKLRVTGLFACTHKSVAIGVPLINAIYGGNPRLGVYTLPLLIWHPMQLVVGTLLSPWLIAFVAREEERLGIVQSDSAADDGENGDVVPEEAPPPSTQEGGKV
jgi:solute carrier family 10 (sodium/bile acid cotransporter), member 7